MFKFSRNFNVWKFRFIANFSVHYVSDEAEATEEEGEIKHRNPGTARRGAAQKYVLDGHVMNGRYEVCYYVWLKRNGIAFDPSPNPIPFHNTDGRVLQYFPDFYLIDTQEYIDVKPSSRGRGSRKGRGNLWKINLLQRKGYRLRITDNHDEWFTRDFYRGVTIYTRTYNQFTYDDINKFLIRTKAF